MHHAALRQKKKLLLDLLRCIFIVGRTRRAHDARRFALIADAKVIHCIEHDHPYDMIRRVACIRTYTESGP